MKKNSTKFLHHPKSIVFIVFGFFSILGSTGYSQIISQYVETNSGSTPKGIEVWNNTGSDIVFSETNNLQIFQGTNGAACASIVNITSGTLEAGELWVIGTSDIISYLTTSGPFPDVSGSTSYTFSFNGDDALQVRLGGVLIDQFGICGSDPGSAWTGSGVSTENQNIELLTGITTGDTDGWTNPSTRFSTVSTTPATLPAGLSGFGIAPVSSSGPCTEPGASATGFVAGTITAGSISASFTGVTADNYLVVRHSGSSPSDSPDDATIYGLGDVIGDATVVYNGSATSFTATGLTSSTLYYFTIYPYNDACTGGPDYRITTPLTGSASTIEITPIGQGDLAIVAINTNFDGTGNPDEVCFLAFKDIDPGASFSIIDNGYERTTAGEWGDTEGGYELKRNDDATAVPAGTVICIQGFGATSGALNVINCGVADGSEWTITNLGLGVAVNLNATDQIWITGSGTWTDPSGDHNATFDGEVLYGWTAIGWEEDPGYGETAGSTIPEGAACYNTDVDGVAFPDKVKYTGPTTAATQYEWLVLINDASNWTGYASNAAYNAVTEPDYSGSCITFDITAGGFTAGEWLGETSTDWFECANWQNFQVPLPETNVVISSTATNDAIINDDSPNAALYDPTPTIASLTIENGRSVELQDDTDGLIVTGNVVIEDGGLLENDVNGLLDINGSITIDAGGQFDLTNSRLELAGDYNNNSSAGNFFETGSSITLNGSTDQNINTNSFEDTWNNLTIEKTGGNVVLQDNLEVAGTLNFASTPMQVQTGANRLTVSNTSTGAITGYGTSAYVNGNLRRNVAATGNYDFPIGTTEHYELATVELNSSTGLTYLDASFNTASVPAPVGLISNGPLGLPDSMTPIIGFLNAGFWEIDPNAGLSAINYDLILTSRGHNNAAAYQNFHGGFKNDDASVATDWEEAGTVFFASAGTGPALGSTDVVSVTNTGITSFSDFAIGFSNATVLPITLLDFTAEVVLGDVLLEWTTVSEINNDYFVVEHSLDAISWNAVGQVSGAGTTTTEQYYAFTHTQAVAGNNYYRLKQVDFNGDSEYSEIRNVFIGNGGEIAVYPNPTSGILNVPAGIEMQVLDASGRMVSQTLTNGNPVNLNELPEGIYTLRLIQGEAISYVRLVKL